MKKLLFSILLSLTFVIAQAQESEQEEKAFVERSMFGIQTDLLGTQFFHEGRIGDRMTLRSEIGIQSLSLKTPFKNEAFSIAPMVAFEPRYYYNLHKRAAKGKNINGNSGAYFGLRASFLMDRYPLVEDNYIQGANTLEFMPTWGVRKQFGKSFYIEAGVAAGYRRVFGNREKLVLYSGPKNLFTSEFNFKVGFRLK